MKLTKRLVIGVNAPVNITKYRIRKTITIQKITKKISIHIKINY